MDCLGGKSWDFENHNLMPVVDNYTTSIDVRVILIPTKED